MRAFDFAAHGEQRLREIPETLGSIFQRNSGDSPTILRSVFLGLILYDLILYIEIWFWADCFGDCFGDLLVDIFDSVWMFFFGYSVGGLFFFLVD